jgi:hypothetical protein
VQATREKFADYITVLKEALRDGAEASAAHTAGISLLRPEPGSAPAEADLPAQGAACCDATRDWSCKSTVSAVQALQLLMHTSLVLQAMCQQSWSSQHVWLLLQSRVKTGEQQHWHRHSTLFPMT